MTLNGSNATYAGLDNQPGCERTLNPLRPLPENAARTAEMRDEQSCRIQFPLEESPAVYWPPSDAMEDQLPPVPAFDTQLLPESLRAMVEDVADRMQVPIDFPAVTAMVALAGAVNRRALIQPKRADHGWLVVPNLWGGIVASPGQKKSPTISTITAPLRKIEAAWREEHQLATAAYSLQAEKAELVTSAWRESYKRATKKNSDPPEKPEIDLQLPISKRLLTSDGTFEALHALLSDNPAGLFVLRDELTGWLASLERSGHEEQRAFYLESWNGDSSFTVDRIGRGTVHVEHCCISLFGGIQPSRLRSYLAEALADGPSNDGLIQRFQLLVWPDPQTTWSYRDRAPSATAKAQADAVYCRLAAMDEENPTIFKFSNAAQDLFVQWLTELETTLASDSLNPVMVAHLAKYRSLMHSLALLLALADGCDGEIPLAPVRRAASWCEYLTSHAHRIYAAKLTPERSAALLLSKRLRGGWRHREATFSLRDVYVNGWMGLGTPDEVRAALQILEEASWVRKHAKTQATSGGRPSEQWATNPRIYGNVGWGAR